VCGDQRLDLLFAAILDSAPDAIVVVDGEGRITVANAEAARMFGYRHDELIGMPVEELVPDRLRSAHVAHRAAYRSSPRRRPMGQGLDLTVRRKDGSELPVEISLSPLAPDDGPSVTAIIRDVTERREALHREQAARREAEESLALLHTFLVSAPLGLAYLDPELRYVHVNDALAAINGVPVREHVGRTPREVLPELGDTVESLKRRVVETGRPLLNVEIAGETPAAPGIPRAWRASYYPVRTRDGRVLGIGCVVEDVTERKRAEAERDELLAIAERARVEAERASEMLARVQAVTDVALAHLSLEELLLELLQRIHTVLDLRDNRRDR
jgi:PAS domain S-box-containing protein